MVEAVKSPSPLHNVSGVMEVRDFEETVEEFFASYDKRPRGWRVLRGFDEGGFYTAYIVNVETGELFVLKVDSPYKARPLGVGAASTLGDIDKLREKLGPYDFGIRPLREKDVQSIRKVVEKRDAPILTTKEAKSLLKVPPVSRSAIPSGVKALLEGPVTMSLLPDISASQRRLESKLRRELAKLMREAGVGYIYG